MLEIRIENMRNTGSDREMMIRDEFRGEQVFALARLLQVQHTPEKCRMPTYGCISATGPTEICYYTRSLAYQSLAGIEHAPKDYSAQRVHGALS